MPQSKEVHKEYMKRYRDKQKSVTSIGVTSADSTVTLSDVPSTETWYPNKRTDDKGGAITPVILSDGQKWYPRGKAEGLSKEILNNIAQAGKIFNDTDERMERALRYKKWNGKPHNKSVMLSNGAYIAVEKLVDSKWRSLLTYLSENLVYQDNIRVGVAGPTIKECKKLLEVTA